jgi:hypothetical protein
VDHDNEEDFLSGAQREKETLPNFYRRCLQLIALRAGPLHRHLVREQPKIVLELYEQFAKFSMSEILYFCKFEQQSKVSKLDEATRPCDNDNQRSYPRAVHNIDSDCCGPPENWEKNFGPSLQERNPRTSNQRFPSYT